MGADDDVLDVGPSGGKRILWVLTAVVIVAAAGAYVLGHRGRSSVSRSTPTAPVSSAGPSGVALPAPVSSMTSGATLRPWPTRDGACGNTAYLPLVSAHRLARRTGVKVLVGDRLDRVDVDAASVRPAVGLPPGTYASAVATADNGTYAVLSPCDLTVGAAVTVARLDDSGVLRTVSRGPYAQLLSGGEHVWGVLWDQSGTSTSIDPLDGGPRRRLPPDFEPIGAYGDLIVGTLDPSNTAPDAGVPIQLLDPSTGRTVRTLGRETTMMVGRGLVLWTGPGCTRCRLHVFDLTTRTSVSTPAVVPATSALWAGVVSPDRRTVAFLGQRPGPVPFAMGHPGDPNQIMTLDLRTGTTHTVPGVVLFAKAMPGLAFSADGQWLVVGADEGTTVRLLVWRPGLPAPLQPSVQLKNAVAFPPALAALG